MKRFCLPFVLFVLLMNISCKPVPTISESDEDDTTSTSPFVERIDTNGVILLIPSFSKVELRCGNIPQVSEKDVILFAEAAYTGAPLEKEFKHIKVAGDHVSNGTRYKGYRCKRNTGAFIYYFGKWKFCYENYSAELDSAAKYNGAAFAQEMMIHENDIKPTARPNGNVNTFRALCELDGKLCVIESEVDMKFGDFKESLKGLGVSEAIYLDMGSGWNYAWYRIDDDTIVGLHPKVHDYCTNWITFYK